MIWIIIKKKKGVNLYYTILYIYYKLRIWWWNSTQLVAHWLLLSRLVHTAHKMSSTHRLTGNITWPEVKADRHWQGEVLKKRKEKKKTGSHYNLLIQGAKIKSQRSFCGRQTLLTTDGVKKCNPVHILWSASTCTSHPSSFARFHLQFKGIFHFYLFFFFCCYFSCRLGLQPALLLRYYWSSDPMLDSLLKPLHHLSFWCLRRLLFLNMIFHFSFPWYIITRDTPIALLLPNK